MASLSAAAGRARDKIAHRSFNESQLICSLEDKKSKKKRKKNPVLSELGFVEGRFLRVTWVSAEK